jgi:4-amino-4-deoxy-L-arabinose transferase-like glycosyltransferase
MKNIFRDAVRNRPGVVLTVIIACYLLGMVIATGFLRCPLWVDETHHIRTIRLFVASFSLHTVTTYAEMHPPLFYMLYALAGIVFGDHVWIYRLLTLFFAATTIGVLFLVLRSLTESNGRALSGIIVFLMNPYVMGLSVFVYSDMPALMFLSLAVLAFLYRRPWLFCAAAAGTILCRQFNVIGPLAVAVVAIMVWVQSKRSGVLLFPLAALLSLIPAVILFIHWGDIAPPNGLAVRNTWGTKGFHPSYIVAYLTLLPVYVAPVIIYFWRQIFSLKRFGVASLIGLVYVIFPIKPHLAIMLGTGIRTVGFFHKALQAITGGTTWIEHGVFYLLFCTSLCLLFWLASTTVAAQKDGNQRSANLLFGAVMTLCFFAVMSCYINVWEKYLVPLLPFFLGWILTCAQNKTSPPVSNER